jgi:hypothetical protein
VLAKKISLSHESGFALLNRLDFGLFDLGFSLLSLSFGDLLHGTIIHNGYWLLELSQSVQLSLCFARSTLVNFELTTPSPNTRQATHFIQPNWRQRFRSNLSLHLLINNLKLFDFLLF